MISIDTDVLRQLVSTATNANNAIDDAVEVLNQITVHNDWACKERKVINEYTIKNKQLIKEIQENSSRFLNVLSSVASEFDGAEKTIIDLFQDIESVIAGVLGSVIWGAISTGDNHNHDPFPSIADIFDNWNPTPIYHENVVVGPDGEIIAVPIVADISAISPSDFETIIDSTPAPDALPNIGDIIGDIIPGPIFEGTPVHISEIFDIVVPASHYEIFEFNNMFDSLHICDGALDLVTSTMDTEALRNALDSVVL